MNAVQVRVWGENACFTRPEMKVERVSYDVMTPSAARGLLEAIHWKPAIRWVVDSIRVLREIEFDSVMRNEVKSVVSESNARQAMRKGDTSDHRLIVEKERAQRNTLWLRKPVYVISAHIEVVSAAPTETIGKHLGIFNRRVGKGQCHHRPYLGTRECAAHFCAMDDEHPDVDKPLPEHQMNLDLGWMLRDFEYDAGCKPVFFRARLADGVLVVPSNGSRELVQ